MSGSVVAWWRDGVIYQVYCRSFADSDGDGVGDLEGVVGRLDYLESLGVAGIWLSPVTTSPGADWGYDVSDYYEIQPELGSMDTFDGLVAKARAKGIRVIMDIVPNHTSIEHPWFVDSRSSRSSGKRDWYVWADPKPDGGPPNNWASSTGGPGWSFDDRTGQYYLHNHLAEQPDLNWWNPDVRSAFDDVMRFWFDRGVAGFRVDVCNILIKDLELRDNPPATEEDDLDVQLMGQRPVYNCNRPEVHDVLRPFRVLADSYDPPRVLIGETPVPVEDLVRYYGDGTDELNMAFNFPFITSELHAQKMRKIVEDAERLAPEGAWPAWTGSNHDMGRLATRWAGGEPLKVRVALMMLFMLRGTPVIYQGDEIGLTDTELARADLRDPLGVMYWPAYAGRDACRTPMHWSASPGGGFTRPGTKPWLPLGDLSINVADQTDDPASVLNFVRDLVALRAGSPDLRSGAYMTLEDESLDGNVWAFSRGESHTVVLNLGDTKVECEGFEGTIRIATCRSRERQRISGLLELGPWEGVVLSAG